MPERRLTYPDYEIDSIAKYGGDVRVVLRVPGSKFGGVTVFFTAFDALGFGEALIDHANEGLDRLESEKSGVSP